MLNEYRQKEPKNNRSFQYFTSNVNLEQTHYLANWTERDQMKKNKFNTEKTEPLSKTLQLIFHKNNLSGFGKYYLGDAVKIVRCLSTSPAICIVQSTY